MSSSSLRFATIRAQAVCKSRMLPSKSTTLSRSSLLAMRAWHSTESLTSRDISGEYTTTTTPELVQVPTLPYLGSLVRLHSGIPDMSPESTYSFWPEMRRKFGNFYSFGVPGYGAGSHGLVYVLQDPHEFMKVIRSEGKYPTSVVQSQWAFKSYWTSDSNAVGLGLFGTGAEWKRIRSFLQTDLLSPQSADRYIPGIIRAAEHASRGAPSRANNLNAFLNEASFDMFSSILLGDLPRITDPTTESRQDDVVFCQSVAGALRRNHILTKEPYELIMGKLFGVKTSLYKEFESDWDTASSIAERKVNELLEKRARNQLSEEEEACYLNQAMDRQLASDNADISVDEVKKIANLLLSVSVDTTSATLSWQLLHIAQNEKVQERIHEELSRSVVDTNGKLTPQAVTSTAAPYLHACIREAHRLTSSATVSAWRNIATDLRVHGVTLPAGSMVAFDGYSQGVDPDLMEDPDAFRPERWLPPAVQARKGTPLQFLDHPLFSGPFSQGARRCPGSRVARNEGLILMAQLVLDYKMRSPVEFWKNVPYGVETAITCQLPEIEFTPR